MLVKEYTEELVYQPREPNYNFMTHFLNDLSDIERNSFAKNRHQVRMETNPW